MPRLYRHVASTVGVGFSIKPGRFRSTGGFDKGEVKFLEAARDRPDRLIYISNRSGTWQVWGWDSDTDLHRQLTHPRNGVTYARISPDGERIIWFDDPDGGERGQWRFQPFDEEDRSSQILANDLVGGYPNGFWPRGVAVGNGMVVVGASGTPVEGFAVYAIRDESVTELYFRSRLTTVAGMSADGELVAIEHAERGNPERPGLKVLRTRDGGVVAELGDVGRELAAISFSPIPGDGRLLVQHERHGWRAPMLWDTETGETMELPIGSPGELGELANRRRFEKFDQLAHWSPDGRRIVFALEQGIDTALYSYTLDGPDRSGALVRVNTAGGKIEELLPRPDGQVWYRWASINHSWQYRSTADGRPLGSLPGQSSLSAARCREIKVDGPNGRIPVTIYEPHGKKPANGYPTVIYPHGGPRMHSANAPPRNGISDLLDAGCLVVSPNYRGSDGYGSAWRYASNGKCGTAESEDIKDVVQHLVESGLADHEKIVICGGSYGGYVGLMVAGRYPDLPIAGVVAAAPICDLMALMNDPGTVAENREIMPIRYGGDTPAERNALLRAGSPMSYIDRMRARILVLYGATDPRTTSLQVETFLTRSRALGKTNIRGERHPGGHLVVFPREHILPMLGIAARPGGLPLDRATGRGTGSPGTGPPPPPGPGAVEGRRGAGRNRDDRGPGR